MPDRRTDDQINDFWNQLVGAGASDPISLDPSLAKTLEQLDSLTHGAVPDSSRERIRQLVAQQRTSVIGEELMATDVAALPQPVRNGRYPSAVPIPSAPLAAPRRIDRRTWLLAAAAILLLLAGMGGWFTYDRLGDPDHPAVIPAVQEATPTAGTESGWPQFRGGPARTGYSTDPGPGGDLNLQWTFTADEVMNWVVSANDTVYAYGRKGDLYALDAATGEQQWAVDLSANEYSEQNRYSIAAVSDGVLYIGTFDGAVVALNAATGELVWQRSPTSEPVLSGPAVADGTLYVVVAPGTLMALDLDSGETIWSSPDTVFLQENAPAVGNGSVFVSNLDGDLVALDTTDGTVQWTAASLLVNRVAAYRDGVVYVSGDDGMYRAVDGATGEVRWTSAPQDGQALNPLVTPDVFIATNEGGVMQALDLATGEQIWSVPGPGTSASPHASKDAVYALSPDLTSLVAYDLATGEELGRASVEDVGSSAAISGETLILSSTADQGVVRSFGPGDGAVIENVAGPATVLPAASPIASDDSSAADATATAFDLSQTSFVWAATGSATDPMTGPAGVTIAPDGTIYVADDKRSVIDLFSPDGTYLETWGEPGSGPGQFAGVGSLGFDADGNIYVFDLGNDRVQKFAPDRTFLMQWGTSGTGNGQFDELQGAVDAANGRVYVAEFLNNRVQVFDLEGNFIDKWGSSGHADGQFDHPNSVMIDPDGNVYIGDSWNGTGGRLQKFDPYGRWLATIDSVDGRSFTEVWGSALDAQGNLYVADYWDNAIHVFAPDLTLIGTIEDVPGVGPFLHPIGLLITPDGTLLVGDYDNGRLVKLQLPPAA